MFSANFDLPNYGDLVKSVCASLEKDKSIAFIGGIYSGEMTI